MLSSEGDNQSEEDSKEVIALLVFLFFALNFASAESHHFYMSCSEGTGMAGSHHPRR
jgi:hypothetical protein